MIENVKSVEEENIIKGLTKNTTSFLLSFVDDKELTGFQTIRNYIIKLWATYRFGNARKIKLYNSDKYVVYYIQFDFSVRLSRKKLTYPNVDNFNMSVLIISDSLSEIGEEIIKEGDVKKKDMSLLKMSRIWH